MCCPIGKHRLPSDAEWQPRHLMAQEAMAWQRLLYHGKQAVVPLRNLHFEKKEAVVPLRNLHFEKKGAVVPLRNLHFEKKGPSYPYNTFILKKKGPSYPYDTFILKKRSRRTPTTAPFSEKNGCCRGTTACRRFCRTICLAFPAIPDAKGKAPWHTENIRAGPANRCRKTLPRGCAIFG